MFYIIVIISFIGGGEVHKQGTDIFPSESACRLEVSNIVTEIQRRRLLPNIEMVDFFCKQVEPERDI